MKRDQRIAEQDAQLLEQSAKLEEPISVPLSAATRAVVWFLDSYHALVFLQRFPQVD